MQRGRKADKYLFFHFRGFGFVTFADVKGVDNVLAQGSHDLDGKKVRRFGFSTSVIFGEFREGLSHI